MQGNPTPTSRRRMHDFYPTPPSHTLPVLRYLDPEFPVWDPAVGDGSMLRVFDQHGYHTVGSDLVDYGKGYLEADFLETTPDSTSFVAQVAQIVTNPPYSLASEFAVHAIEDLHANVVALLLPAHYLGTVKRARGLFQEHPPTYVGVVPTRMNVPGSGMSQFYHAWFVWKRWQKHTGTLLEWL